MTDQNHIVQDITDFIFIQDQPEQADVIIVVGGSTPDLAITAAGLYANGFAPRVLAGGKYSLKHGYFKEQNLTGTPYAGMHFETECEFYTHILKEKGVPEQAIIPEDQSTNTGGPAPGHGRAGALRQILPGAVRVVRKTLTL